MINKIEQIQFNAWPALITYLYDGWVLRISEGVTRRSNSISPIYNSRIDLNEKIAFCENYYKKVGLPIIYKLTKDVYPVDLDRELEARGYLYDAETSVQIMDLDHMNIRNDPDIRISGVYEDSWIERFIGFNGYDKDKSDEYSNIIKAIDLQTAFLDIVIDGRYAGVGLGVINGKYLGLFDIVVKPGIRKMGYGKKIVEAIMAWGKENGAKTAYLQVMTDNYSGLRLYERIGFKEVYKYWYRIKNEFA